MIIVSYNYNFYEGEVIEAEEDKNRIIFSVYVQPRSNQTKLYFEKNELIFRTKAKPERYEVNKSLIKYLSKKTGKPISKIKILSGYKDRVKTILIEDMSRDEFERCL